MAVQTWPSKHGAKRAWGTNVLQKPGGNEQRKSSHLTPTEIAVKRANWKSLLDNVSRWRNQGHKRRRRSIQVRLSQRPWGPTGFRSFFYKTKGAFAEDPCLMVIAPPLTGLDDPVLAVTSDEVWGE
jgi:hypothetical protein